MIPRVPAGEADSAEGGAGILGVVTHAGTLRMTLTSHDHPPGLAADIVGRLEAL